MKPLIKVNKEEIFIRFSNKVVLITGAAGGIGKETARQFAEEGASLALVDLDMGDLEDVAKELGISSDEVALITADVSDEDNVKNYVKETIEKFGTIDVLFNNAGIEGKVQSFTESTEGNLNSVIGVNVNGVFFGIKHVMPIMMEKKTGVIINTSSVAGHIGFPGLAPYVASKHAILGLTKTAALEAADSSVRVNAVSPSPVDNRMMRSIEAGVSDDQEAAKEDFKHMIPLNRYAKNSDIASLVLFLASDDSNFITGQDFRVDGGMGAK